MTRKDKIQHLIVTHLIEEGCLQITLPDGMIVELGIIKEGKDGSLEKQDDYCWLIASQKEREVSIDSYNLALKYKDGRGKMIVEDSPLSDGMRVFSIV